MSVASLQEGFFAISSEIGCDLGDSERVGVSCMLIVGHDVEECKPEILCRKRNILNHGRR